MSIEVLEHLEDPLAFIRGLKSMLVPGGFAYIAAAITAPNEDHIYLYNNMQEVEDQLTEAGFEVLSSQEDVAYPARHGEPVPRAGAFICQNV